MDKIGLIIRILLLVVSSSAFGTSFTSTNDGSWDSDGTWTGSGYPSSTSDNAKVDNNDSIYLDTGGGRITIANLTFDNNGVLYIASGDTLEVDTIYVKNNGKIYVEGVLIVNGGVQMDNNSDLTVDLDGAITIDGDFEAGSGVDLTIDGDMEVAGDFTMGSGSSIAGSGSIDVAGTVDIPPGSDPGGVLPVVLRFFKATRIDQGVFLQWETLAELNNNFFTIERSTNGYDFEVLTTMPGGGTTEMIRQYEYLDRHPMKGVSYYRLKQTDFDGTTETFHMVAVQYFGGDKGTIKVYPNPVTDGPLHLEVSGLASNEVVMIDITTLTGEKVVTSHLHVNGSGMLSEELAEITTLPAGLYILILSQDSRHQSLRFIKK